MRSFHSSFKEYSPTPLIELTSLAQHLGIKNLFVKDESYRFGLNAFKVLGGSFAIGSYIANELGEDIDDLPYMRLVSDEVRSLLGSKTFITTTDGNHGRGVAWTANRLKQQAIVYMPQGSAAERLANIRAEGAQAEITDMNYDDTVRYTSELAQKNGWINSLLERLIKPFSSSAHLLSTSLTSPLILARVVSLIPFITSS